MTWCDQKGSLAAPWMWRWRCRNRAARSWWISEKSWWRAHPANWLSSKKKWKTLRAAGSRAVLGTFWRLNSGGFVGSSFELSFILPAIWPWSLQDPTGKHRLKPDPSAPDWSLESSQVASQRLAFESTWTFAGQKNHHILDVLWKGCAWKTHNIRGIQSLCHFVTYPEVEGSYVPMKHTDLLADFVDHCLVTWSTNFSPVCII